MGDPKKHRKKYSTPRHPWEKERIDAEIELKREYGLKNKKEIWKVESKLKHFAAQAKSLIAATGEKAEDDKKILVGKLIKMGVLKSDGTLDDILTLKMSDLLERRLQTVLVRKGLSKSVKQARQFIVHGHVTVADRKVTVPSYFVGIDEEGSIAFADNSSLKSEDHPERGVPVQDKKVDVKAVPETKKKAEGKAASKEEESPKSESEDKGEAKKESAEPTKEKKEEKSKEDQEENKK